MKKYLKINIEKPVRFYSAGHFIAQGEWVHPCRIIDNIEILIGCGGTAYVQHGDAQYELRENGMITFLPFVEHKGYEVSTDQVAFYWFHLQASHEVVLEEVAEKAYFRMQSGVEVDDSHVYIPLYDEFTSMERAGILFHQLLHQYADKSYGRQARNYATTNILLELHQLGYRKWVMHNDESEDRKIRMITEWIRANSHRGVTYEHAAEHFNYNKSYLNRYFKSHMGMTINHYIHVQRIEKAKELLYRTDKTIKEIAHRVGYKDEKYFLRIFKKVEQMTPSRYRNIYYGTCINSD